MKHCESIREHLDDWLDEPFATDVRQRIESHLKECPDCRRYFQIQRSLADDLAELGRAADRMASSDSRSMSNHVASRDQSGKARRWRWRSIIRTAAAIVLLVTAWRLAVIPRRPEQTITKNHNQPGTFVEKRRNRSGPTAMDGMGQQPATFSLAVDEDHLALLMKSKNPRIHIVWVYDRIGPVDRAKRDKSAS